jgi:DNA-binding CsgD family transcriptional regulator
VKGISGPSAFQPRIASAVHAPILVFTYGAGLNYNPLHKNPRCRPSPGLDEVMTRVDSFPARLNVSSLIRGDPMNFKKHLSKHDAFVVLELINDSLSCSHEDDLARLKLRLRDLMPPGASAAPGDKRVEVILELITPHLNKAREQVLHVNRRNKIALSPKEREILGWMKDGKNTLDMSVLLGITERTVKFHISNIMKKLDAMSRTHAVALAIEKGLLINRATIP